MRVLVQRALKAELKIDNKLFSSIEKGIVLFVGFTNGDDSNIISKMSEKIAKMRIFEDENGKTNLSLASMNGQILCVSQFTLYGSLKEGNRPSFTNCLSYEKASSLYELFLEKLIEKGFKVSRGVFGA
ncbi:MAG TPA: D-tyrosyl-tRNA(Tyr) deacylase, partial [Firmicutes bacterium]|nr:D-tyrosyl-tRNA(Tyr) deacylase [Bacillota bacterium]